MPGNDEIFNSAPLNDGVTLDTLVGDNQKYKTPDELAKAYVNADNHLDELRRDNAQLKAERDALKITPPVVQEQAKQDPAPPVTPKAPEVVDTRSQIREELKAITLEQKFEENVETTAQKLIEVYGDPARASEAVKRRAAELGVGVEWLRDAAARSPSAFYASMGIKPNEAPTNRETPAPKNEMRTDVNLNQRAGSKQSYAHFNELRKTDKARYYSVAVQAEMQKAAREQGDAFYA